VLAHARALLASTAEGACDYVDGDLREPGKVVAHAARTLDFSQPVALMLLGILHHIPGTEEAYSIVGRLVAALAPGSSVVINHSTSAIHGAAMEEAVAHWNQVGTPTMTLRGPEQIARFSTGWTCWPPGWCRVHAGALTPGRRPGSPTRWTNSGRSRASCVTGCVVAMPFLRYTAAER
jgi:hypothetical protein